MSYDIFFWRETPGANLDPDRIVDDLEDMMTMPGIVPISLETVNATFRQIFPECKDCGGTIEWEGEGSYFHVGFTFLDEKTITLGTISCGYELVKNRAAMERLAQTFSALGCRVHNPQQAES
jgi:hypothetical protein